ncbi:2-oxoglutarate and iron-dependent oxygenase JMJD4 homolog [Drosophila grimshawi]|uniref:Jumonji domain-containing protein 4 n=1 Tax=Drosophila grimshawi TaxID=7222 RepID=B4JDK2_DROGR|nr:2-oxoglutarate and iron-dependent oxygenase JMJD4 homolog [Drosophila grimshawi]EDW03372.1 GH10542 [Drosophila grimshawi]
MASEKAAPELLALQPEQSSQLDVDNRNWIIERRAAAELSYNEFYWKYMRPNWPVIITDVSNSWECRNWAQQNNNNGRDANDNCSTGGHINFDYLRRRIGNLAVPVADCNATYFNSHAKLELKFHDFLARWQSNVLDSRVQLEPNFNVKLKDNLYLKDWHLAAQLPSYEFYKVPKYFASDWLNEQLIAEQKDDYRFVYMGPKDSWTSFHSDVFGSFSWSTNIVGHKKWLIMPPGEELKLADRLRNLPFSIDESQLEEHKVRYFTINQTANEAIFVPSGWYHQVWNMTDTISVNHNWFNACNIARVWSNLLGNLKDVRKEIADCQQMDNFEAHCQTMLRASFGINYLDFIELLEFIVARRIAARLKDQQTTTTTTTKNSLLLFDKYEMNDYHVQYDLECVQRLLKDTMLHEPSVQQCPAQLNERCERLLQQLPTNA